MTRSRQVATGSVDVSLIITIVDDTGLPVTGLVAATFPSIYLQLTGVVTPSALVLSDLAAQNSAHSDGGVKELTGGRYRLDAPDAPFVAATTIDIIGEATGKRVIHPQIEVRGDASVPGDEMDFIDSPNVTALTAIGAKLELMILDEGDATALLAAISAKVEEFLINEGDATATMAAIAASVRTNLTTELGRIDVAISTRNATAPDNTQGAAVITALGNGTVVLHSDYDAAKYAASQSQITGGGYSLDTDANGRIRVVDGVGVGELDTLSGTVLLRSATQSSIDAIELDTNELQGDWVNGGRLDLLIDAIKAKTDQMTYSVTNKLDSNPTPTAAICNRIADHVRRRTQANVEASSDGDTLDLSSLYGFIQQAQESLISETTLTVNRTDGTTALGTKTLTSSASAEPVTGIA